MATLYDVGTELSGFHDNFLSDSFLNPDPLLYTPEDNIPYLCYPYPPPPEVLSTPIDDEFEFYQPPKRQKISCNDGLSYSTSSSDITFDYQCPVSEFVFSAAKAGHSQVEPIVTKPKTSVSAQSVAARQRRRKISEKTQKLGKLIPGGNRMNTAEMFHAASKYVKFLQAQVGMLQLMQGKGNEDVEEEKDAAQQGLELLLASPSVHEKLYSEEKCLVPQKFVADNLAKDDNLRKIPFLSKQIDLMIQKH
ncbi:hypothetical protein ACHQM5_024365 [Ranunculus cassubicifolius]